MINSKNKILAYFLKNSNKLKSFKKIIFEISSNRMLIFKSRLFIYNIHIILFNSAVFISFFSILLYLLRPA